MEYHYRSVISYDGTAYQGWQAQGHTVDTVTQRICASFYRTFKRKCTLIGASRTDAGVHALGQVARLTTDIDLDSAVLRKALNAHLPFDIDIRSCDKAAAGFHPLHGVRNKRYYYHIAQERPLPYMSRFVYTPYVPYSYDRLAAALSIFKGEHDFRSFCTGYDRESTVRRIDMIYLESMKNRLGVDRITIEGAGFLRHMIRRIVGAALTIAASPKRSVDELNELILAKNPQTTLATAPAHGLLLRKIWYIDDQ